MKKSEVDKSSETAKKIVNNLPYFICIIGILVIIIRAFVGNGSNLDDDILVKTGTVELTHISEGIVIKDESVIVRDTSKTYISTTSAGKRVASNAIIATYKTEEYENYMKKLEEMDNEILQLMQDLPMVYSSETQSLAQDVNSIVKEAYGSTSHLDMQLSLNSCNDILSKKAEIIANSSETGTVIKELIKERNKYVEAAKASNDNILSTKSGIVSYQTDNLENVLTFQDVDEYSFNDLKDKLKDLKNTGNIKVVNNYQAYICVQVPIQYEKYIKTNKTYNLRILEVGDYKYRAQVKAIKKDETNGTIDVMFDISSGIENLINIRDCQVEITWWTNSGLYVPVECLYKYDDQEIYYVTILKLGKQSNIPVIIKNENGKYALIENYKTEDLEKLGITRDHIVQLYDRLITRDK